MEKDLSGIFINYRHGPHSVAVAALAERLSMHFGRDRVFVDHRMNSGSHYPDELRARLADADVLVAVVHQGWADEFGRRDPDWVRREIAQALSDATEVVPVYLEDVDTPTQGALPEDIRAFALLQGARLRAAHLAEDMDRLVLNLERWIAPDLPPRPREEARHRAWWLRTAHLWACALVLPFAPPLLVDGGAEEFAMMALMSLFAMIAYLMVLTALTLALKPVHRLEVRLNSMPYRQYIRKTWITLGLLGVMLTSVLVDFVRKGAYWRFSLVLAIAVCVVFWSHQLLRRYTDHDEEWPPQPSAERHQIRRTAIRLRERLTTWPDWRPPRSRLHQEQAAQVYLDLAEAKVALLARRDCPWRSWLTAEHSNYPLVFAAWAVGVISLMVTAAAMHTDPARLLLSTGVIALVASAVAAACITLDRLVKRRDAGWLAAELTEWQRTVGPLVFLREHIRGR
ncbi:toll/interleukin-1 receptor domain-containing protein [Saccharothrix sp. 6-C]|uniref:TIR domain-containing protein n=1 Tax=Saccharothrix sp. 6-C TaxID=2781735 RepID=UPI001917765B|nr:TIR domain-containing protein [Saccharothrix sp. 6-C]QQQ78176.1 toll/interleukin-1 receptor domain-containing protein [Saccharothrix sp. 6-C]